MENQAHFLMCAPHFFGVEYVINPWMQGKEGSVGRREAEDQWHALHHLFSDALGARVFLVPAQPGLPDMVFTANAGLTHQGICVPARFRHSQRQGEELPYRTWFEAQGLTLRDLPEGICFEGAGDALFDEGAAQSPRPLLWAAHGFRTDLASHAFLSDFFGVEVVSLGLIDPRYYHLDTCFCPLPNGFLLWNPMAFDEESRETVERRVWPERRFAVSEADARQFACNAVGLIAAGGGPGVVLNVASDTLVKALESWGFAVYQTPLGEFMKAGGSAKCLTLRLSER